MKNEKRFVIGYNSPLANQELSQAKTTAKSLTALIDGFRETGLPMPKPNELKEFAKDPAGFHRDRVRDRMKEKNMEDADPAEFARLYKLEWTPKSGKITPHLIPFLSLVGTTVGLRKGAEDEIRRRADITADTPEEIQAARLLMRLFRDFTYVQTILLGSNSVATGGTHRFGFGLLNGGSLDKATLKRVVQGMEQLPREEFNKRLAAYFANPGLQEVIETQTEKPKTP